MKLFFIPLPKNANPIYTCPRTRHMIRQGLAKIPEIEIVEHPWSADFHILDYVPHDGDKKYVKDYLLGYKSRSLVIIDNSDEHDVFYLDDYYRYFKRSLWVTDNFHRKPSPSAKRRQVYWFDYGVLDEFIHSGEKSINYGCYLRPSCAGRQRLMQILPQLYWKDSNPNIGPISGASRSVSFDPYFDTQYFDVLSKTRLLFTCQPYGWVSDSRLYEALACGCTVFTDKLYIQYDYPFIHHEHLIEYNLSHHGIQELVHNIDEMQYNTLGAKAIANAGKEWAIKYHSSEARMRHVIEKL